MNNSNGATLLARIRPGCLVTLRDPDGRQATGRAYLHNGETLRVMMPAGHHLAPTAENVTQVRDI